jgi:tol-pal system protein YbgF
MMPSDPGATHQDARDLTQVRRAGPSAIALALLLCACWFPQDRGQRLEQRVERIEGEGSVRQLDEDRTATQERARKVDTQIAALQKKLDALDATSHQPAAAPAAGRDELAAEIGRLRASLDQQGRRLDAIEKTLAQARSGGSRRVAERRAASAPPAVKTGQPPVATGEPTGVLAMAREQEGKGQKAVARDLYLGYVQKFPTDPDAAEAHFRLGELAFGDRKYQEAIAEFGTVAKNFPKSERAPAALLRTADAMLALDLKDDAVSVLSEIPKRYPSSPAASRARTRLAELSGSSAPGKQK